MNECFSGSHFEINNKEENKDLEKYVDWLNDEKYNERKNLIKFLVTLGSAILTFTVSFRKDIIGATPPEKIWLLQGFWITLLLSIISAFIYYFLEYRYMFYIRVKKVTENIPKSHYCGKIERMFHTIFVYLTPITFLVSLLFLTIFILLNVK
ncbi:MAG: hypothetical protein PVH61_05390 [Candidatus Aminicenantes bacterium]|jgi:hypothetical protein